MLTFEKFIGRLVLRVFRNTKKAYKIHTKKAFFFQNPFRRIFYKWLISETYRAREKFADVDSLSANALIPSASFALKGSPEKLHNNSEWWNVRRRESTKVNPKHFQFN